MHLRDLLRGRKNYFQLFEVNQINVPKFKALSVGKVYEKVKDNDLIMSYIPDFDPEETEPKVALCREFFFNIINTLDPEFFPKAIESIEAQRLEAQSGTTAENLQVEIIPELYDLIQYGTDSRGTHAARSLAALRRGSGRRRRP